MGGLALSRVTVVVDVGFVFVLLVRILVGRVGVF
jgi:hypothetical protein